MSRNTVSRRELKARFAAIDVQFAAQEKAVSAALAAADRAVIKSETAVEKRFENSNEWRNTVETLQRTYMPRTEFEQSAKATSEKIDGLTARANSKDDRGTGESQTWVKVGLGISILANLFLLLRGHIS